VPKTILLLRHAEKPFDSSNPNLSPEGYDRAEELATFIPDKWGKPDFIFASEISRHSARPIETMKPLSKATGIKIDHEYADQDYEALAQLILTNQEYDGALIVICWHHNNIPGLAQALNANTKVPSPWDATVFDLIVDIEYGAKSSSPKVKLVTQNFAAKV
jgi:broad specificity phosphatase PhoE